MAKFDELHAIAAKQHGMVTRADLHRMGWSDDTIRRRGRVGLLVPSGRQTFVFGGDRGPHQEVMAACLESGGFADRGTGAWMHGISGFGPGDPPSVVVPKARSDYRLTIADVHASTWLPGDDVVVIQGIPVLSVARTLFSLAAAVPSIDLELVRGAIDEAVRDRKATDAWLWWLLERIRCRGRNGVSIFEELLTARAGGTVTESWLEREFLRVLGAAGLDLPTCQRRIARNGAFVARVDFAYDDLRVVIEVTGHTSHSTRRQTAADAQRRNELTLAGWRFIEFTYDLVVADPAYVIAKVVELLGERRAAA